MILFMVPTSMLLLFLKNGKTIFKYFLGIPRLKALEMYLPTISLKLRTKTITRQITKTITKPKDISQSVKSHCQLIISSHTSGCMQILQEKFSSMDE